MPLDLSYTLFWVSLAVSAAAVIVFLWLMREPSELPSRPSSAPHPDPLPEGEGSSDPLSHREREG